MSEKIKPFKLEESQEEADELREKVKANEVKSYGEAAELINQERYTNLLRKYLDRFKKIKLLERRARGVMDPETRTSIEIADQERHNIHLELLEVAKKIGKTKNDVIIDIIRHEGNLEEYGLPEFLLISPDDLDEYGNLVTSVDFTDGILKTRPERRSFATLEKQGEDKVGLEKDEVVIVYDTVSDTLRTSYGRGAGTPCVLPDSLLRIERGEKLAKEVGGKLVLLNDSAFFHSESLSVAGVAIPKSNLVSVAGTIRNNPEKFRIGKHFYSTEEQKNAENYYVQRVKKIISYLASEEGSSFYTDRYLEKLRRDFPKFANLEKPKLLTNAYLENIKTLLGEEAYHLAKRANTELIEDRRRTDSSKSNKTPGKVKSREPFNPVLRNIEELSKNTKKEKR